MREDLNAYLDGELSPDRVAAIESALNTDANLRRELAELRSIRGVLRSSQVPVADLGLDRTLAALQRKAATPWFLARPMVGLSLATGAAVAVFAVMNFSSQRDLLRGDSTATEMRPAYSSPKIEASGNAILLDNGETLAKPMVSARARSFELKGKDLDIGIERVEQITLKHGGTIDNKVVVGGVAKLKVQMPTQSVEAFLQALDPLSEEVQASSAAPVLQNRTAAGEDAKGVVVEVVLRLAKDAKKP